ncbi:MAG: pyrophosphatase [Mesorhizobium sp.]|uniref:nucleoside triphosphate pyrophosphohydrolase family protein n=1 Tax=Mesorhizobium sp. TaxID=1871066 RepID=UPI000FEAB31A|nr:nucleoside triphosphate pyrophosphohydrolase family protein [Mesorhizobium sp.]RWD67670.1 MAG: pyrophosphatase [Mesorhizobium sp.]RWE43735.1 MAG: pyrophosphatase [Mesorhizobium sp.]
MSEFSAGTLTLDVYQKAAHKTDKLFKTDRSLSFPLLGIFGEAGSILSEVKKKQRDRTAYIGYQKTVIEEFGDTLWYLNAIACRSTISLAYIGHNIDRPVEDWQFYAPEDLKFVDLQKSVGTIASEPSSQFEQRLLKLAAEVGLLVADFQASRLEDNQASIVGRLVAILRCLRDAAEEAGLSLADAAAENLRKSYDRWPQQKRYPPLFDADFPEHEQLPRRFSLTLVENGEPGKRQVTPYYEGSPLGDKLTDNRMEDDDYRFHDAFHMAFAAKLGWSPNLRRLLKRKRKSIPKIDEVEDGARAVLIEEGVSTWVFNHAQRLNLFEGVPALDYGLLKTGREFVEGYEVANMPLWLWEEAILSGYDVFRQLQANRGGVVTADLENRTLGYSPNS